MDFERIVVVMRSIVSAYLVYRHNQGGAPMGQPYHQPMSIVTACVDNIRSFNCHFEFSCFLIDLTELLLEFNVP